MPNNHCVHVPRLRHGQAIHHNTNTFRSEENGRHYADDIFQCTFLNENNLVHILPKCSDYAPDSYYLNQWWLSLLTHISITRPRQMSLKISLKFVPKVPINNIPALVQIMAAWRRPGDKSISETMMVCLLIGSLGFNELTPSNLRLQRNYLVPQTHYTLFLSVGDYMQVNMTPDILVIFMSAWRTFKAYCQCGANVVELVIRYNWNVAL